MKLRNYQLPAALYVAFMFAVVPCYAQTSASKAENKTTASSDADTQKKNTEAYLALLRRDVRQEKAEIMGSMMLLNSQDSAKFCANLQRVRRRELRQIEQPAGR